ncbi:hypothetical protein [Halorhabdus sp. CUG00001]|uniref:hypothetical protein n=1 Tax=Halorhabdus sp. CUG00001 TaxID=2600297 RepID=UPI00131D0678|nr:hypothetical protein [Halorhabdus sp. CUG00001]
MSAKRLRLSVHSLERSASALLKAVLFDAFARAVSVNHQRVLGLGRFEAIDRTLTDRFGNLGTIYGNSNRNGTM